MIRINLLDSQFKIRQAVAEAIKAIKARSFSGRNPQLGKMINCPVCLRRHRGAICVPNYAVGRYDLRSPKVPLIASQTTRKGIIGAAAFAKKRFKPHHNKRDLQLVQRTQQLFPLHAPYSKDPLDGMREARLQAARELKKEREAESKEIRRQQKTSRRINRRKS